MESLKILKTKIFSGSVLTNTNKHGQSQIIIIFLFVIDKVVALKVYAEVPPKVEYSLTEYGKSLEPVMFAMRDWGAEHMGVKCK